MITQPEVRKDQPEVPFLDLYSHHSEIETELVEAFRDCVKKSAFVGGVAVASFEQEFAAFTTTQHAVGVSSGTDAIRFALSAAGIGPGDIVITVPNSFVATTEAISQVGARIRFVDIDPKTSLMDVNQLTDFVRKNSMGVDRPKAIIPVHLYGQCVDMDPVMKLAEEYGLKVIEDACQAHGATYKGRKAGSIGHAGTFSFYPGKNLGALGEGGAVTTNDKELADKVRLLRDHGQKVKYFHAVEGFNGRLHAIQAAFLRIKLPYLDGWNARRRNVANHYREYLSQVDWIDLVDVPDYNVPVYHLFVVHTDYQQRLFQHMKNQGINCAFHYPVPLHMQECYRHLGYKPSDFPNAEKLGRRLLSLPMFPALALADVQRISEALLSFDRST